MPTYFRFLTLMAFLTFMQEKVSARCAHLYTVECMRHGGRESHFVSQLSLALRHVHVQLQWAFDAFRVTAGLTFAHNWLGSSRWMSPL
jgi:hypothetical protein